MLSRLFTIVYLTLILCLLGTVDCQPQQTSSWTFAATNLPESPRAALATNGRQIAIVTGGITWSSNTALNSVYVSSDQINWIKQTGGTYFTARMNHGMAYCSLSALPGATSGFYIFGGQTTSGTNLGDLWYTTVPTSNYDTATSSTANAWKEITTAKGTAPTARGFPTVSCSGANLFVFGGGSGTAEITLYNYNTQTKTWTSTVNSVASGGTMYSAYQLLRTNQLLYVAGSDNGYNSFISSGANGTGTWTKVTGGSLQISYPVYATIMNGSVGLLIGGENSNGIPDLSSIYALNLTQPIGTSMSWTQLSQNGLPIGGQLIQEYASLFTLSNTNRVYIVSFATGATFYTVMPTCSTGGSAYCLNGATCSDLSVTNGLGYQCSCSNGWLGSNCAIPNLCVQNSSSICSGHGICTSNALASPYYSCSCTSGYSGTNCQIESICLSDNPCLNGATCVANAYNNETTCSCASGYYGSTCSYQNPCLYPGEPLTYRTKCGYPEQAGGDCIANLTNDTYECDCYVGWSGVNCSDYNPCLTGGLEECNRQYSGHGICTPSSQMSIGYLCSCNSSFVGTDCNMESPCLTNPTLCGAQLGYGECLSDQTASPYYRCECFTHFVKSNYTLYRYGTNCSYVNACLASTGNPCLNGGTCVNVLDTDGLYTCTCASGFNGTNCQFAY